MMGHEDCCTEISVPMESDMGLHRMCMFSSGHAWTEAEDPRLHRKAVDEVSIKEFLCTPEKQSNATVYNPFDTEIESLSLPSFSPSVFQAAAKPGENDNKPFSWSIDQMAVLAPADIDETSHHDIYKELDYELEQKAQKAIETYFSHDSIVPSPWGMTAKQVTFSPKIASTACFTKASAVVNSVEKKQQGKEVWTQTVLSIPPNIDILDRLGEFCTFHGDQYLQEYEESDESFDAKDSLSISLRRKLFTVDRNSCTPQNYRNAVTPDAKTPSSPLLSWKTPEKKITSFFTPGSAHFSSSPISSNCSISSNIYLHSLSPPPVSPISKSTVETPSTGNSKSQNRRNKTPTCTSSPIVHSLPDVCLYTESTKIMKTPNLQRQSNNIKASVRLSLLMLSTSDAKDEDYTEEMRSEVSLDIGSDFPKISHLPSSSSHDTGYQTKSYQSTINNELPPNCTNSTHSPSKKYGQTCENNINKIHGYSIGTSDSQIETSNMDVDSFHQRYSGPIVNSNMQNSDNVSISCSNWKPSVCSTPHL